MDIKVRDCNLALHSPRALSRPSAQLQIPSDIPTMRSVLSLMTIFALLAGASAAPVAEVLEPCELN